MHNDNTEIKTKINLILNEALNAPSGDNVQPWKFSISESRVILFNDPNKDQSLYNFDQLASYISLGALLTNIQVVSSHFGCQIIINLFPDSSQENVVAFIDFIVEEPKDSPLYRFIKNRVTNRKPYSIALLSEYTKTEILQESGFSAKIINDREGIKKLAWATSRNEFLVLTNKLLHKFLFDHIKWNKKDADESREGFYIKTFEMNIFELAIFKLASSWGRIKILNKIGLSKKIASENEKVYRQSGGFIAFVMPDSSKLSFLQTGMNLQRVWLKITSLGLSMHPLTGIILLKNRLNHTKSDELTEFQKKVLSDAYDSIADIFTLEKDQCITFLARIGKGEAPSSISPKKFLDELIIIK